jgi:hypothetical protein
MHMRGVSDGRRRRRRSRGSGRRRQQSPTAMPREEVPEEHMTAADSSSLEDELVRQMDEEGEGRMRRELVPLPLVH